MSNEPFPELGVVLQFLGRDPKNIEYLEVVPATMIGFYIPHNDGRFVIRTDDGRIFHIDPYPYHENEGMSLETAAKKLGFKGRAMLSRKELMSNKPGLGLLGCKPRLWKRIQKKIDSGEWGGEPTNGPYVVINDWNIYRNTLNTKTQHLSSYWVASGQDHYLETKGGVLDEDGNQLPFGVEEERLRGAVVIVGIPGENCFPDDIERMSLKVTVQDLIEELRGRK